MKPKQRSGSSLVAKAVCGLVDRDTNKAELIPRSTTFGFHMKFSPNGFFEREIGSAVFLARPTQAQTALLTMY
jgi:hypothetical protein